MSVPLDNLYHWVESLLPDPAVLYVFRTHGSKKISDLQWLKDYASIGQNYYQFPGIICHDQEPLDWDHYNKPDGYSELELQRWKKGSSNKSLELIKTRSEYCKNFNLKSVVLAHTSQMYDQTILVHSEKNSTDLAQYQQNGFVCVHYWAHAIIARDWYRFAKIDPRLTVSNKSKTKFLIYCRDWSYRREYRLKFLELLARHQLKNNSIISVMHTNSDNVHFSEYTFLNPDFKLIDQELIYQFQDNNFSSTASADYNYEDFVNSEISVVLETVFDGSRIHLTEKTLRPIACGHPFILAAGPGSLEYLRNYGFRTFAPWIDESYDTEINSVKRMEKIIQAMKQIQNLQGSALEIFSKSIKEIADYNKKHFFSNEFFNIIESELQCNLNLAYSLVKYTRGKHYLELIKRFKKEKIVDRIHLRQEKTLFIRQLRQSCQGDRSSLQADLSA